MKYIAPLHYTPEETVDLAAVKVGMRLEVHMRTGKHTGREFYFTVCKISEDCLHDSCFVLNKADLIKGMAELRDRDYKPAYSMVKGEGAGQYTFDLQKDSQLAML